MKLALRDISALALLAFAAPALPCGEAKQTHASNAAQADQKKQAVAKSDVKKSAVKSKGQPQKDKGTASN